MTARAYLDAVRKRCDEAICSECDGRGSLPDRPGYSVLCVCADGLSLAGEDMPSGQFVRDAQRLERIARLALDYRWSLDAESTATHSERIAAREALFAALESLA